MGTVGLNFGSPTSGTGFDVAATVTQIVSNLQGVEQPWKSALTSFTAKDTAISGLGTQLSTLSTDLGSLTDFQGALAQKQGSSSDTGVIQLTAASPSSIAGTHAIVVNWLAQTSSGYLDAITNSADTLSGTLSIQLGTGNPQSITIDTTNNNLTTLAAAINNGSYGVTASVLTDTHGSRLSLVSSASGEAGSLTVTSTVKDATTSTSLSYNTATPGLDASLEVDGIKNLSSASNTVSALIPGVTFQLLAPSPVTAGTPEQIQVQVLNNNSGVVSALSQFITDYNAVVKSVNSQETKNSDGTNPALFGSPTVTTLQTALYGAMNATNSQGSLKTLSQLGVDVGNDGTLTLNTSTFNSVLESNFKDVISFFQNSGSWGQALTTSLNNLGTTGVNGALALELKSNAASETSLNDDITKEDAIIAAQKTQLTAELTTANQTLQSIPSNLNNISLLYSAITGYQAPKF